jgi:hypothetical protein
MMWRFAGRILAVLERLGAVPGCGASETGRSLAGPAVEPQAGPLFGPRVAGAAQRASERPFGRASKRGAPEASGYPANEHVPAASWLNIRPSRWRDDERVIEFRGPDSR